MRDEVPKLPPHDVAVGGRAPSPCDCRKGATGCRALPGVGCISDRMRPGRLTKSKREASYNRWFSGVPRVLRWLTV